MKALQTLLLALALTSCSLVVDIELPEQGNDSNCEFLNAESRGDVDECVRWQFNAGTLECELVPLDRDNDGFFPAECLDHPVIATVAADVDCDDDPNSGGINNPDAPELCDGIDNDCDTRVDEGVLVPVLNDNPTITFNDAPNHLAYAVDDGAANSIAAAYTLPGASNVPGAVVRDRSFSSESADRFNVYTADANNTVATLAVPAAILSDGIDVAALGNNQYAVAFINPSGGRRRLIAGVATQDRARTLLAETSILADGLPCTAEDGDCAATAPLVDSPVVGVSGTDVLVTAVRRTFPANECPQDVGESRVVGNALTKRDFSRVTLGMGGAQIMFPALRPTTANPIGIELGVIREDATPAVIGLPGVGFVLALPQTDNTLLLRTVTVTDGVYAVATARDVVLSVDADEQPLLEPAFAISSLVSTGSGSDPRRVLALAFRRGCAGAGTVQVKLFNINPDNGNLAPQGGAPRKLDGEGLSTATSEGRPAVSFSAEHGNTWVVAFAKRKDLRARVLSFDGTLHGTTSTTLILEATRIGLAPTVFPTPLGAFGGARYGAMVDATVDGATGIFTVHLGCFESGD